MLVIAAERASRNNDGALTYGFGELDEWLPPVPAQSARAKVRLSRLIIPLLTQHYAMLTFFQSSRGGEPSAPLAGPQANVPRNIGCGWWSLGSDADRDCASSDSGLRGPPARAATYLNEPTRPFRESCA
jgi:hypothetical protein